MRLRHFFFLSLLLRLVGIRNEIVANETIRNDSGSLPPTLEINETGRVLPQLCI